jgi:hypothetical protein
MRDFRPGATEYTFLLDEDVKTLVPLFPKRRVKTLARVDLPPAASDDAVVLKAWNRQFTIVTGNGRDFRKAIADFQQRGASHCSCLFGLVVLPNGEEVQKQLLFDFKALQTRLRFKGKPITWKDVRRENYEVRLMKTGQARVTELPRCKLKGGH